MFIYQKRLLDLETFYFAKVFNKQCFRLIIEKNPY